MVTHEKSGNYGDCVCVGGVGHLDVESGLWGEVSEGAGDHNSGTLTHTHTHSKEKNTERHINTECTNTHTLW